MLKTSHILVLISLMLFSPLGAQNTHSNGLNRLKKPALDIKMRKTGPYFGYERGKIDVFAIGAEYQMKQIKLIKPSTHGIHGGFDYNFKHNILGFEAGYWHKPGRLSLTLGGDLVLKTNFDANRFGLGPAIGYRLFGLHLQAGYHWLTQASNFDNVNTFFIRLRFTLVNDRDLDITRNRKKKKR